MARRSSFSGASQRRRTGWEEGPGTNSLVNVNSSSVAILGNTQAAVEDGLTVVRIRGFVELLINQMVAVTDGFTGALGIGIATTAAIGVGVTAVPTPITEVEWEGWLWHQFFSLHATEIDSVNTAQVRQTFMIDSKAMRKLETQDAIYAAIEVTETGSSNMVVRLGSRMLLKLP